MQQIAATLPRPALSFAGVKHDAMARPNRSDSGGKNGRSVGLRLVGGRPGGVGADHSGPNPTPEITAFAGARGVALNPRIAELAPPDVLVLAVKPQSLDAVAPPIAALAGERTLVLSILTGKTIANLKARLPLARAIVRAMPNTPAAIGRGVTAAFANSDVDAGQRRWSESLFGAVGTFHWLADEAAIDAVTAIPGSGRPMSSP